MRRAAIEDSWSQSLRAHLETCIHCRAAAAVAPVMDVVAKTDERQRALPPATVIWLKAQLMRSDVARTRTARPLQLMQVLAYLAVAAGWTLMLMLKWTDIQRFVLSPVTAISESASVSMSAIVAVTVLGSITFALAMHTILAEE